MRLGLVVREGWSYPAARVRALQFLPGLTRAGIDVRTVVWRATSRRAVAVDTYKLLALAAWADVVLLQRPSQPRRVLDALVRINRNVIVDFDDALWTSVAGGPVGAYGRRLTHAVTMAKHLVPGSEYLGRWARSTVPGTAITVIRPSVDLTTWPTRDESAASNSPPVIGWIGTPSNLRDFGTDALTAVQDVVANNQARLRLITSGEPELEDVPAEVVRWSVDGEGRAVAGLDIGLMPLVDDERSRGRCGYKAIQYLASGVPVVASPVGAATEIVAHDRTGLLASTFEEWRAALADLSADGDRRRAIGASGHRWVEEEASLSVGLERWLSVLREVAR